MDAQDDALLLGFGFAFFVVGFVYCVGLLHRFVAKRIGAKQRARELVHLVGLDRFEDEITLVQARRKQLEPRYRQLRDHREKLLGALDEFRGTQAERDFEARLAKVDVAYEELRRAYERLCELEAELWMRRAAFGLLRQGEAKLRVSRSLSTDELEGLRMRIEETVRGMVDPDVRQLTWRGSRARSIVDEAEQKLREHLAALRLRELDARIAEEVGTEHLDALVVGEATLEGFEGEMRELDAMTEAVLEVERVLEPEPRRLTG